MINNYNPGCRGGGRWDAGIDCLIGHYGMADKGKGYVISSFP
jgi:hypothetical protein